MDFRTLIRDPSKVHEVLVESGDSLICTKDCKLYFPVLWEEKGLVSIGTEIIIPGIFAISVDDRYYGVSLAIANMRVEPSEFNVVELVDGKYYEFIFDAGSVLCPDIMLPQVRELSYYIYDLMVGSGKIPSFMSYLDIARLFIDAEYHVGLKLGANVAVIPMIISTIARVQADRTQYYRHHIQQYADLETDAPAFIAFSDVTYNATNTVARMIGAYYGLGVNAALVNPSTRLEKFEVPLRA